MDYSHFSHRLLKKITKCIYFSTSAFCSYIGLPISQMILLGTLKQDWYEIREYLVAAMSLCGSAIFWISSKVGGARQPRQLFCTRKSIPSQAWTVNNQSCTCIVILHKGASSVIPGMPTCRERRSHITQVCLSIHQIETPPYACPRCLFGS